MVKNRFSRWKEHIGQKGNIKAKTNTLHYLSLIRFVLGVISALSIVKFIQVAMRRAISFNIFTKLIPLDSLVTFNTKPYSIISL